MSPAATGCAPAEMTICVTWRPWTDTFGPANLVQRPSVSAGAHRHAGLAVCPQPRAECLGLRPRADGHLQSYDGPRLHLSCDIAWCQRAELVRVAHTQVLPLGFRTRLAVVGPELNVVCTGSGGDAPLR